MDPGLDGAGMLRGPPGSTKVRQRSLDGLAIHQHLRAPAAAGLPGPVRSRQHFQRLPQLRVEAAHIKQVDGAPQRCPAPPSQHTLRHLCSLSGGVPCHPLAGGG